MSDKDNLPSYGSAPATGSVPKIPDATPESVAARLATEAPDSISQDAPVGAQQGHVPTYELPKDEEPAPAFDLSKLTPEQLIALKAALDNAPLRITKKGNPIIKLRRLNERLVLDFGTCINTLYKDELTQVTSEVVLIPVKFMGVDGKAEEKWTNIAYKDFMNAEQIKCEVLDKRSKPGRIVEGEVESNERPGIMVELEVITVQDFFTVKLPEGMGVATVEVEGKIANA